MISFVLSARQGETNENAEQFEFENENSAWQNFTTIGYFQTAAGSHQLSQFYLRLCRCSAVRRLFTFW
jgi:hypothetical protein